MIVVPSTVTSISSYAFSTTLRALYYKGDEESWANISKTEPTGINENYVYYYSEDEPTTNGNYWHYVDGEIVKWENA